MSRVKFTKEFVLNLGFVDLKGFRLITNYVDVVLLPRYFPHLDEACHLELCVKDCLSGSTFWGGVYDGKPFPKG